MYRAIKWMILIALVIISFSGWVWGRVYLDIDSPTLQKIPIAVTDVLTLTNEQWGKGTDTWLSGNLSAALELTGLFQSIPKEAFLEDQKPRPFSVDTIHFEDWSAIGAEYVIKGRFNVLPGGREMVVTWRLFDAVERKMVLEKQCRGRTDNRGDLVYPFVDDLLNALTGERGIFDTRVAIVQKKGSTWRVISIAFDGTGLASLMAGDALVITPRWSPDGKQLAYTSYQDGQPALYIRTINGRQARKIASFPGINLAGPWSPDGRKLLMTLSKDGNEEIYVMELKSGRLDRLTNHPAIDVSPTWSPDGRSIAFVSSRSGAPQIYVMNSDGSNIRRLTFDGPYNSSPAWSPRGNRIAYEGRKDGFFQIFTLETDGSKLVQVTSGSKNHESPTWSPDGRYLAFGVRDGGAYSICVSNSGGTGLRVLYESKDPCRSPIWSPRLSSSHILEAQPSISSLLTR
ncbi:MAG: Tol-Pal system beta propeller repeat protein TolB [Syntrophales bacterium]|jgi:TolB protein